MKRRFWNLLVCATTVVSVVGGTTVGSVHAANSPISSNASAGQVPSRTCDSVSETFKTVRLRGQITGIVAKRKTVRIIVRACAKPGFWQACMKTNKPRDNGIMLDRYERVGSNWVPTTLGGDEVLVWTAAKRCIVLHMRSGRGVRVIWEVWMAGRGEFAIGQFFRGRATANV